jgi:ubiquinone/menaquinone biosynthesis C-methylase UbiE
LSRTDSILASFAPLIQPRSRILDIGAGKGLLAEEMARQFNAHVTLVDIAKYNQSRLPLTVCDSRALAFANRSFDYALLSFVLHHSQNPNAILREALRVAHQVIVIENDVPGIVRQWLTRIIDSYPALRYGTPLCHIAQSKDEWLKLFATLPIQTRVISEFSSEYGFFQNFTVILTDDERQRTKDK